MARTKQTARKVCAHKVPRKSLIAQKIARKSKGKGLVGAGQEVSDQELEDIVNTQQFSIKFEDQDKCQKECVVGEIFKCKNCQAVLTCQNELMTSANYTNLKASKGLSDAYKGKLLASYENVWICQLCACHNSVPKKLVIPKLQNPCFLIQEAKIKKGKNVENSQQIMLIFCIDISGSMELKVGTKSRLESVKEALADELNRMKFEKTKVNVAIITFGSTVNLLGDGDSYKETQMETSIYHDFDKIVHFCGKIRNFCLPLSKSYKHLKNCIQTLSVYGSTALGPGLVAAVEIASQGSVGSKVILCTDGEANVGIGGNFSSDRFTFYNKISEYAKNKRVMVNILSLKGDRCNLKELGKLSLATGGSILKIEPSRLGTEFAKITKQEILGSQSTLIVKVCKIFEICHGNSEQISKDKTTLVQNFGNFSADTQLTFEFEVINKEEATKRGNIDLEIYEKKKVPMQLQLSYVGRNGNKYTQIITDWRQLTDNEKDIYDGANFGLFAASILQRSSKKIKENAFKEAQSILRGYHSLVEQKFSKTEKKEDLMKFNQKIKKIQRVLASKMRKSGVAMKDPGKEKEISRSRSRNRTKIKKNQSKEMIPELSEKMSSDEEEEVLWRGMRARSRSRSVEKS